MRFLPVLLVAFCDSVRGLLGGCRNDSDGHARRISLTCGRAAFACGDAHRCLTPWRDNRGRSYRNSHACADPRTPQPRRPLRQRLRSGLYRSTSRTGSTSRRRWAVRIAAADVIAQARFLSLDHAIRESEYHGHVVELRYRFEVAGYLKGDGPGEVTVLLESGPVYTSYPDAFRLRTEEEARDLADTWPARNRAQFVDRGNGILLLTRRGPDGDLHFGRVDDGEGQGGEPVIGEAWLDESDDSTYLHLLSGSGGGRISLGELSARIEEIDAYMDGQYASCVFGSLIWRSRVRDQIEGTYRELTVRGFAEPDPFPRLVATLDAGESEDADVLNIVRPPFQGPRFSDYWLDGPDKDLFETDPLATIESSHEWVYPAQALSEGEYHIHYAQYHSALPCGYGAAWIVRDATELVVQVADSP